METGRTSVTELAIYHLKLCWNKCDGFAFLNGFPIVAIDASWPIFYAPPINLFLIGKRNKLIIEARQPHKPLKNRVAPSEVSIIGSIAKMTPGTIVGPDDSGEQIISIDVQGDLRGESHQFPLRAIYEFDNDGPSFREVFLGDRSPLSEAEIVEYGLHLLSLVRNGDVSKLIEEFEPKIRDYAAAYEQDFYHLQSKFTQFVEKIIQSNRFETGFGRLDIRVRGHGEGRFYELHRTNNHAFFETHKDASGGILRLPIYVKKVEGCIRIIR